MKKVLLGLLVLILIISGWVLKLVWDAGQFKDLTPHFAGTCRKVYGVVGPEDITINPKTGIAYISAYDRRAVLNGQDGKSGIYAYDTRLDNPQPVLLTSGPGNDFRPHGISLYSSASGEDRLFVINHSGNQHSIEVFEIKTETLEHKKTYKSPLLISPNDIVAVGSDKFYVTNDHGSPPGFQRTLEDYLKLSNADVVYYNGTEFSQAAAGFQYANGINISADGKTVYLTTTIGKSLHFFSRDTETGALKEKSVINLNTGLDNIELDQDKNLWIGSHPKLLTFIAHAGDPKKISPSQLFKISSLSLDQPVVDEIYLNNGEELSASSVVAVKGKRLIVGAVFDDHILDCTLD